MKSHKSKTAKTPSVDRPFEDALARLERIVADLERGESDLAETLASYQEGVQLLGRCQTVLDQAERLVTSVGGEAPPTSEPTVPSKPPTASRTESIAPPFDADEDDEGDSWAESDEEDDVVPF